MVGAGLGGKLVELAGIGVTLDPFIEQARLELLEPIAQLGDVLGRKAGNGRFDIFQLRHDLMLSTVWPLRGLVPAAVARVSFDGQYSLPISRVSRCNAVRQPWRNLWTSLSGSPNTSAFVMRRRRSLRSIVR